MGWVSEGDADFPGLRRLAVEPGHDDAEAVNARTDARIDLNRRRLLQRGLALGAFASTSWARTAEGTAAVATTAGRVRGFVDGDLDVFRGIRYGADTGPRRFQPPSAPQPWKNVRDTREFGAASPQPGPEPNQSEDCLFLNVVAPRGRATRPRPVIVYVHGGAYSGGSGSSPLYDGSKLCRRGDVV